MAERYFTPEEVNGLLPAVRLLVESMVAHRRSLQRALARQEELAAVIGGNGGGLRPQQLAEVRAEIAETASRIERCVEGIHELGGLVKDVERGLVDWPAWRAGAEVLLCWRLGEDEVRYWHGLEEGFAGRRELPL